MLKSWLKGKSAFWETVNGVLLAVILYAGTIIYYQGVSFGGAIKIPFLLAFLTVAPISFSMGLLKTTAMLLVLSVGLVSTIKYLQGPWIRYIVALLTALWWLIGIMNLSMMY